MGIIHGIHPLKYHDFWGGFQIRGMGLMEYKQQISTRYTGDICWLCIRDSNNRLGDFA